MPTFGSLFSGIGGLDLGLERAGWECKWQVEIDDYCRRVLAKHWPDVPRYGDVRDVTALPYVDLIAGGFPCQPVSAAGKRRGRADERWLWPEFLRILRIVGPRWVLVENVQQLLSAEAGQLFGGILRDLAESGYDAEWDCLPAAAFGAPHLRYRVFIVAYPNSGLCNGGSDEPEREEEGRKVIGRSSWWGIEPDVGRVAHGVPSRVDRLTGLGNAVVPQVAEWIGRRIMRLAL